MPLHLMVVYEFIANVIRHTADKQDQPTNDGLAKSRRTGENRCPVFQLLFENTGFRLSPE
jgi:hypothetical protein